MPITEILNKNSDFYPNDVALVEINPLGEDTARPTWREYSLIEAKPHEEYKKEITALKEKYAGKIDLFLGLEFDMYSGVDLSGYD